MHTDSIAPAAAPGFQSPAHRGTLAEKLGAWEQLALAVPHIAKLDARQREVAVAG